MFLDVLTRRIQFCKSLAALIKVVLTLSVFVGAAAIVASGYFPHPHLSRVFASVGAPYSHTYETWGVLKSLGVLSGQALVLWAINAPDVRSWRRPLASALALLTIIVMVVLFGDMHPSAPEVVHGQWSFTMIALLFLISSIEYFRSLSR